MKEQCQLLGIHLGQIRERHGTEAEILRAIESFARKIQSDAFEKAIAMAECHGNSEAFDFQDFISDLRTLRDIANSATPISEKK